MTYPLEAMLVIMPSAEKQPNIRCRLRNDSVFLILLFLPAFESFRLKTFFRAGSIY